MYRYLVLTIILSSTLSSTALAGMPGCNNALPWELTSKDCETYLPNIHYADAIMNQQISDLRMENGRMQIDRLIYPTIAAPNLFFKGIKTQFDANTDDELVVMLNLEKALYSGLVKGGMAQDNSKVEFDNNKSNGIFVYLVARDNDPETGDRKFTYTQSYGKSHKDKVIPITASAVWAYGQPAAMPVELKTRKKFKLIYDQAAIDEVSEGFYDIRMEVVKDGKVIEYEYQYKAVRIFDKPEAYQTNHDIINVTDSQISLGNKKILSGFTFKQQTHDRVIQFVEYLNSVIDKKQDLSPAEMKIQNSAFITFNGDVHNGGSPKNLMPSKLALTYQLEAQAIIKILRDLPIPIFLTIGNHDGYMNTGVVPANNVAQKYMNNVARQTIGKNNTEDFVNNYLNYIDEITTENTPGGKEVDVHMGSVFTIKPKYKKLLNAHLSINEITRVAERMNAAILKLYAENVDLKDELNQKLTEVSSSGQSISKLTRMEALVEEIELALLNKKIHLQNITRNALNEKKYKIIKEARVERKKFYAARQYERRPETYAENWLRVSDSRRNYVLYDGINQWRRTYGPTYQSWGIGNNLYVNVNSYELRQHMRAGYGMYTVNYGGGVSQSQMDWIKRAVRENDKREVVLLTHHDFRGGHKNVGHGYFVRQVPYKGMGDVAVKYALGEVILPKVCSSAPEAVLTANTDIALSCLQDGLQEWMQAEEKFDCAEDLKYHAGEEWVDGNLVAQPKMDASDPLVGTCDLMTMQFDRARHPLYSGYQLIHLLATNKNIKTYIIGHTHYNTLEVMQPGQALIKDTIILDATSHQQRKKWTTTIERVGLVRAKSWLFDKLGVSSNEEEEQQELLEKYANDSSGTESAALHILDPQARATAEALNLIVLNLDKSGHNFTRHLNHGLVIMRFTSIAKLSEQTLRGQEDAKAFGFTLLSVNQGQGGTPLINEVTLMRNTNQNIATPKTAFTEVVEGEGTLYIDRSKQFSSHNTPRSRDNPLFQLFYDKGARPAKDPTDGIYAHDPAYLE